MSDIIIKATDLGKRYVAELEREFLVKNLFTKARRKGRGHRDFWALSEVNFEIHRGESVGIVGRNGAGKSTLLRLIAGATRGDSGALTVNASPRKIVGLMNLTGWLNLDLTGLENIYYAGALLGLDADYISSVLDDIAAFAEVDRFPAFLDTPTRRFSAGMGARLAFALAMHSDPELLLIDEVLAVGDVGFRQKCFAKIRELQERGVTIIIVSHHLPEVIKFCSKALWLREGKQVAYGEVESVGRQYEAEQIAV